MRSKSPTRSTPNFVRSGDTDDGSLPVTRSTFQTCSAPTDWSAKGRGDRNGRDRVYASLTVSFGVFELLFGVFLFVLNHHGSGPVGMIFVVPGLILATCGIALWRSLWWGSPLAIVASLVPWIVPFAWYPTPAQFHNPLAIWLDLVGLAAPATFVIFALLSYGLGRRARPQL